MSDAIYQLIDQKIIDYAEIVVNLFDHCNMRCAFCFQDHEDTTGLSKEGIMSKVPIAANFVNNNTRSKYFKLHFMGGEVFQDHLVDSGYLDIYQEFYDSVCNSIQDKTKVLVLNPITNLVFDRTDQVMDFLIKNDIKVSVSYDSKGRFNRREFATFKRNVEIFKEKIEMISVTITRQTAAAIVNGDEYFDYLYKLFPVHFDPFLYTEDTEEQKAFIPHESEVLALNKYLIDNYPECLNIQPFVYEDTQETRMECTRGNNITIYYNNFVPSGCSGEIFLKDRGEAKPVIIEKFIKRYDCFNCEYYKRCPFTCFVKDRLTDNYHRDVDGCVFKASFDYA